MDVNAVIGTFAHNKEEYLTVVELKRVAQEDAEKMAETREVQEEASRKPDNTTLLREIRHLIKSGKIESTSGKAVRLFTESNFPTLAYTYLFL